MTETLPDAQVLQDALTAAERENVDLEVVIEDLRESNRYLTERNTELESRVAWLKKEHGDH